MRDIEWPKGPVRWQEDGTEYISIPFTWNLPQVREEIIGGNLFAKKVVVGGPAVKLHPDYMADVAEVGTDMPGVLQRVQPFATKTTEGCVRRCGFCAVPRIEGEFRCLEEWPNLPIICDNNLLASDVKHFDKVIDGLKMHDWCDFNQGLDARLLTDHHARRLAELPRDTMVRLAWDSVAEEEALMRAIARLRKAGIPKKNMRCYVLIGFRDTPEDALYRLETLFRVIGILPNPMRYVPCDGMTDSYVGPNWTDKELTRMQRYWSRITHLGSIPYEEFDIKEHANG